MRKKGAKQAESWQICDYQQRIGQKWKKNPKKRAKKGPPATATVDAQHRLWVYETVNSVLCATWRQIKNLASNQQFYVKSRNLRHWPLFKRLVCRVRLQSVLSIGCGSQGGSLSVCSEVMDHSRSSGSERGKEKRNKICKNILAHRKSLLDAVE